MNPWNQSTFSERRAAWWLAGLDPYAYSESKVEADFDEALPNYNASAADHAAYYAGELNHRELMKRAHIQGWHLPPATDTLASSWLEKLRLAVEWGELPIEGDTVSVWDPATGAVCRATADQIPPGALTHFCVDVKELKRWRDRLTSASTKPPNGFYVVAMRLAMAGGAPKTRVALESDMDQYGIKTPGKNTLDPTLKAAKDNNFDIDFKALKVGQQAHYVAMRLFEYAYLRNELGKKWTNTDLEKAKKAWREGCDSYGLEYLLGDLLKDKKIKPNPTRVQWCLLPVG